MHPRITFVTLAVDDLDRSVNFYRDGLGLFTPGIIGREFDHGAVAFFDMQPGLKLALFPRENLAHDAGVPQGPRSSTEFALAHNVASQEQVDALIRQAEAAGAVVIKPPQTTFWGGYAGYFADPDGHLWDIAWNPNLIPDD